MRRLFLLSAILIYWTQAARESCIDLYCSRQIYGIQQSLNCQETCKAKLNTFYILHTDESCSCGTIINPKCSRKYFPEVELLRYCRRKVTGSLPSPIVRRDNETIIIRIPRFYTESGFAERNPRNLTLFINFISSEKNICKSNHVIKAVAGPDNRCQFQTVIPMPGIDYKTDNVYHYDNRTDLETTYSTDMPGSSPFILVWIEVSMQESFKIAGENITLSYLAQSNSLIYNGF